MPAPNPGSLQRNLPQNLISLQLSDDDIRTINSLMADMESRLTGLLALDNATRRQLTKMGDKSEAFVPMCEVDRLFNRNGTPMVDTLHINPPRLMVAKWCGNPRYEEMCGKYIESARSEETRRGREDQVNTINMFEQKYST